LLTVVAAHLQLKISPCSCCAELNQTKSSYLAKTSTSTAACHQLLLSKIVDLQNTLEQNMCTREIAKSKHVMALAAIKQIQNKSQARTSEETADRTLNNNSAAGA
jgi:hypothetical protein